jgi:hypothetical protein
MTRDTSKSFSDVVIGIARRKLDALEYRKSGKPDGIEESRDVYRGACQAIAGHFKSLGFKYRKTHPHFSRKDDLFRYKVSFQSSHHNVPGHHVQLWMHATVHSEALKAWRATRLPPNMISDYVAGGMVHRLTKHAMVEWELANPVSRPSVIADAVAFTRSDVLPYFDQFRDVKSLIQTLSSRLIPAFDIRFAVEFALCFGDQESGQRVLDHFLKERSDLLVAVAEVERVGLRHPATGPGNFAEQVVFMCRAYQLRLVER